MKQRRTSHGMTQLYNRTFQQLMLQTYTTMNKPELRLYFKELLLKNHYNLNSGLVKAQAINKISKLIEELKVESVGIYYPLKYEIDLFEIVKLQPRIMFFLPKIIENKIKYCAYNYGDKLVLGSFKTYEPINNDFYAPKLVIIPGLGFSFDNYRLGYGKGHFDRYINNNRDTITVGICLKEQLIDNFPYEPHDQKLDFVVFI